jgi:hypothetical protein
MKSQRRHFDEMQRCGNCQNEEHGYSTWVVHVSCNVALIDVARMHIECPAACLDLHLTSPS